MCSLFGFFEISYLSHAILSSASENVEAVEPTPGPSAEHSCSSLMEQLKAYKVAKTLDAKNLSKLSPSQRKRLEELRRNKQVGHFQMPDASQPIKGKGKGKGKGREEDTRVWLPCPLLEGVPAVPPPHISQPWEAQLLHDITEEENQNDEIIEGTPPDVIIPQRMLFSSTQSVMDITMDPPLQFPQTSMEAEDLPTGIPPQKKYCKIQCTEVPQNPVLADIEFLGFTPTSTTLTTSPASGTPSSAPAYDLNVDIDVEHDMEPGEGNQGNQGSEVDEEEYVASSRHLEDYPLDSGVLLDPTLSKALQNMDSAADSDLRNVILDQDWLDFDWRCEPENFEGVREVFTVTSTGPTFEHAELTPSEVFLKIWDAEIIAHIVRETNRHGRDLIRRNVKPNSRLTRWKDVTDDDIKKIFAIIMLQSLVINNVEREYWYPKLEQLTIGNFRDIMPYNRFIEIKRCLHFVDNASLPVRASKLDKIMLIIEHLNKKFCSLYVLEQNVVMDESLLLWKGRLTFAQKIASKKARVGIKSYELCESRTGYLWRMEVYSGKGHVHVAQVGAQDLVMEHEQVCEPVGSTSQIVLTLMI